MGGGEGVEGVGGFVAIAALMAGPFAWLRADIAAMRAMQIDRGERPARIEAILSGPGMSSTRLEAGRVELPERAGALGRPFPQAAEQARPDAENPAPFRRRAARAMHARMYVRDILKAKGGEVFSVGPDAPVAELVRELVARRIGAALVRDGDRIVGIVSERDVLYAAAERGGACLEARVRDLMTVEVVTCGPDTMIDEVMNAMTSRRIRHIPVIEDGALAGVVSIGDVVKSRIESAEREASQLREYIQA